MKNKQNITPKEWLFCYFFHLGRNGKQAAIKAGYRSMGAERVAAKLLQRDVIQQNISEFDQKMKHENIKSDVIAGLHQLAFGSTGDAVRLIFSDPMEQSIDFEHLELFGISEIKRPKDGALEIKFFDRFKALGELARIAGERDESAGVSALCAALQKSASRMEGSDPDE